eukprot:5445956-Amphidinium_carterae.1
MTLKLRLSKFARRMARAVKGCGLPPLSSGPCRHLRWTGERLCNCLHFPDPMHCQAYALLRSLLTAQLFIHLEQSLLHSKPAARATTEVLPSHEWPTFLGSRPPTAEAKQEAVAAGSLAETEL